MAGKVYGGTENAALVDIFDQRPKSQLTAVRPRDAQAHLAHERHQPFQHAGHLPQVVPGAAQFFSRPHAALALAVIAQLGGFQQALASGAFQGAGQVLGQRRAECQRPAADRMLELEPVGVQELAL